MLNRRTFLGTAGSLIFGSAGRGITDLLQTSNNTQQPIYSGWIPNKQATQRFKQSLSMPMFRQAGRGLAGTGAGQRVLLWKYLERVTGGELVPHDQGIGDCVSHAWGLGIDMLDAIQVAHGHGSWNKKCATEIIYAGARVEIGNGRISGDGLHGVWAARWCRDYGILLRQPYLDGKYDFTQYSASKARKWAHKCQRCTEWGGGVPDELEPIAKRHPVKTTTLVNTWEEARDAIANGYPIALCSDVGFTSSRDRDGFADRRGTWNHSMLLAGIDDTSSRPGGLIINSWGDNWIDGPTRFDQPIGSFWAEADVIESMLRQDDSFALSSYVGYPRQNLDYRLY